MRTDKVPLIVPPTYSKSEYFQHSKIKAIWRSAHSLLSNCGKIYVVGYSLPESDVTIRSMLNSIFSNSSVNSIELVDISEDVCSHYIKAFPNVENKFKTRIGNDAVEKMVEEFLNSSEGEYRKKN
jgi:hypothetical protein